MFLFSVDKLESPEVSLFGSTLMSQVAIGSLYGHLDFFLVFKPETKENICVIYMVYNNEVDMFRWRIKCLQIKYSYGHILNLNRTRPCT